ncbi:hypothetical protein GCM10023235_08690 [Kitasatospora terrestris]|uniref:Uncharacterized protein n=1 Tax=Kitasatospora terrestris TaxID=258051 RepID=A0ABP9DA02_9ACTN
MRRRRADNLGGRFERCAGHRPCGQLETRVAPEWPSKPSRRPPGLRRPSVRGWEEGFLGGLVAVGLGAGLDQGAAEEELSISVD